MAKTKNGAGNGKTRPATLKTSFEAAVANVPSGEAEAACKPGASSRVKRWAQ